MRRVAASYFRATPTSCPLTASPGTPIPSKQLRSARRLYGRGTSDMKSFSAIGLAFVPEFLRRGLKRPLHFSLSYDEEVGCIGVRRLIADVSARGIRPAGCIVGEPTGMQSGGRAQRQEKLPLPRSRPRGALVADAAGRQRGAGRLRGRHISHPHGAPFSGSWRFRCRLRRSVHDGAYRRDSRRHRAQHRPARLQLRIRIPASSLRRSGYVARRSQALCGDVASGNARRQLRHAYRIRPAFRYARLRHAWRKRDRRNRQGVQRHARFRQGIVRDRSRAVPQRRHFDDHLRTRAHRASAPAERVGFARATRSMRSVHAPDSPTSVCAV